MMKCAELSKLEKSEDRNPAGSLRYRAICKTPPHGSISEESLYRRLTRLDARIRNQFDLVTSRTGWLLASTAFLFAAYFAALTHPTGDLGPARALAVECLLVILPSTGILFCVLIQRSISAAYSAVASLKEARASLIKLASRRFGYENTEPSRNITADGDLPPKVLPAAIIVIWIFVLVFSFVELALPV